MNKTDWQKVKEMAKIAMQFKNANPHNVLEEQMSFNGITPKWPIRIIYERTGGGEYDHWVPKDREFLIVQYEHVKRKEISETDYFPTIEKYFQELIFNESKIIVNPFLT